MLVVAVALEVGEVVVVDSAREVRVVGSRQGDRPREIAH